MKKDRKRQGARLGTATGKCKEGKRRKWNKRTKKIAADQGSECVQGQDEMACGYRNIHIYRNSGVMERWVGMRVHDEWE